jgi:hypothetical protein
MAIGGRFYPFQNLVDSPAGFEGRSWASAMHKVERNEYD